MLRTACSHVLHAGNKQNITTVIIAAVIFRLWTGGVDLLRLFSYAEVDEPFVGVLVHKEAYSIALDDVEKVGLNGR